MAASRSRSRRRSAPPARAGADTEITSSPLPQSKSAVADFDRFVEWPNPRYSEVRLGRGWGWGSSCGAPYVPHLPTPHPDPPPQGGREKGKGQALELRPGHGATGFAMKSAKVATTSR